jgi:ketosteroid isomerase-like protein
MNILKSAAIVAVGLLALAGCQKAPTVDLAAFETKAKADVRTWLASYNSGDVETIVAMYADDAILMAPGYPAAVGRDAIRELLTTDSAAARAAGVTLNAVDNDTVGASGDLAWHSGSYTANDATGMAVDSGNYLEVQQNIDGKWLIIRDIYNSDRPKAPPAEAAPEDAAPVEGDAPAATPPA